MSTKQIVKELMSDDAFVMVSKKMSREIGFVEAGILGEMISTHNMCDMKATNKQGQKFDFFDGGSKGEWFYLTQPKIEATLNIKRSAHDGAIRTLKKENVITQKKMGLPAKNYYLLNWARIGEILSKIVEIQHTDDSNENEPKKDAQPLIQSACQNSANKGDENQQTKVPESNTLESRNSTAIITSNKNDKQELENKNSFLLSHDVDIASLNLPMPLKKFLYENRDKGTKLNMDLYELEEFYNMSDYIKPLAGKEDLEHLNNFEFTKLVKDIYKKEIVVQKSLNSLLNDWVLSRLHFKKENAMSEAAVIESQDKELDLFNNPLVDNYLNKH
jgi:hypothetical protein